jgi:hypothetical protein
MSQGYGVLVMDNAHYMDQDEEKIVSGFATLDEAVAYATNRVSSSLEELYKAGMSKRELTELWRI